MPGVVLDIAGYNNEQSRQGSCPHGGDILVEKGDNQKVRLGFKDLWKTGAELFG